MLKIEAKNLNKVIKQLKDMELPEVQNIILELEILSSKKLILAQELNTRARLEDLNVYKLEVKRYSKKQGVKTYQYWYASWRNNSKIKNVCLGNTKHTMYSEALAKARRLKAEHLCVDL